MNQKKMKKMNGKKTRLIDADALKIALYYDVSKGAYGEFMDGSEVSLTDREILQLIDEQPTIDAVPVRHGKWIYKDDGCINCSECGADMPFKYYYGYTDWISNYCPNCGARIDKE